MNSRNKKYKVISLILLYGVYINIFLMGDDFLFASYHIKGIRNLFFQVLNYGMNGRLIINLLESLVLCFDRYLYVILMPIFILLLVRVIGNLCKNIQGVETISEQNKNIQWLFCVFFFAVLSINLKREAFYWISGSFNYLYPIMLLVIYTNVYYKIRKEKKVPFYLPFLGFILGASSEQISFMACGIFGCVYIYQILYKKQKIYVLETISYFLLILGTLSLFLSAGTIHRMGDENEKLSIVQNIFTLLYNCSYSKTSAGIVSAVILVEVVLLRKYIKKWHKILYVMSALAVINLMGSQLLHTIPTIILLGNIYAVIIFSIINIIFFIQKYKETQDVMEGLWFIAGIGSQIMLLVTDVWGFRTTFPWVISLMVILMLNINQIEKKYQCMVAALLMGSISSIISVIAIVLIILIGEKANQYKTCVSILFVGIIIGFTGDIAGYYNNREVHLSNVKKIKQYDSGKLYLKKVNNMKYSWVGYDEFHTKAMLNYYEKDANIKVIYR